MGFACFNLNYISPSISIKICKNIYVRSTYINKAWSSNKSLNELNLCVYRCKSVNRQCYNFYNITNTINLVCRLACSRDRSCNNDANVDCKQYTAVGKSTHWICCSQGKLIRAWLSFICCSIHDFGGWGWILIYPRRKRSTVWQLIR
jgi:hypothetical protein